MNTSSNRTVFITGSSSGIGQSCALRMMQAGWSVFAGVRKAEDAEKIRAAGRNLVPVLLDLKERASISAAAQQVAAQTDARGLDGLVNVAGIGLTRPVEYVTADDLQEIFDVNVFGQIAVTQAFLPLIRKARGRIVNISSRSPGDTVWWITQCKQKRARYAQRRTASGGAPVWDQSFHH